MRNLKSFRLFENVNFSAVNLAKEFYNTFDFKKEFFYDRGAMCTEQGGCASVSIEFVNWLEKTYNIEAQTITVEFDKTVGVDDHGDDIKHHTAILYDDMIIDFTIGQFASKEQLYIGNLNDWKKELCKMTDANIIDIY